ncbi:MAG: hypothetical protein BSR46_02660 [Candidatus Dactylopiibacterium carminicum]|nr:MAG: hypothetical protein BSR46_02660 [Candidatus Dactylopiibacterium carminicum]
MPLFCLFQSSASWAQEQVRERDPARVDPVRMIECAYDVPTYLDYASVVSKDPQTLGLRKLESDNPFLYEYELATPIQVFGLETRRIAMASGALLAALDDVKPQTIAERLKIEEPIRDDAFKYMAMRVVHHTLEQVSGVKETINTVISLEVSTVITHPGKVLAGCSYRVNTF